MTPIDEIRNLLRDGKISREDFWRRMQGWHLGLRQYQSLIGSGAVGAIEITAEELRVVTRAGVKLVWYPEDLRTAPNVLVNTGEYEPVEFAALAAAARGAEVIFDIGANIGYFSLHWASDLAPGGTVHAFEPVPTTFQRLARNVALNDLGGKIVTNNKGVGSEPATLSFYLPDFSGSGAASSRNLHPEENSAVFEAEVTTLDSYFGAAGLDRLDLVKVDVEGAELLVVKGGLATIEAHKPILFLELLRKWSKAFNYHPNDVLSLLRSIGYECFAHDDGVLTRFGEMTDKTVQTNFFFAHPARHGAWLAECGLYEAAEG